MVPNQKAPHFGIQGARLMSQSILWKEKALAQAVEGDRRVMGIRVDMTFELYPTSHSGRWIHHEKSIIDGRFLEKKEDLSSRMK